MTVYYIQPLTIHFLDTFSTLTLLNPAGSSEPSQSYNFSSSGIAWPGEAKKYATTPIGPGGYPNLSSIVPPPNWRIRFPNNYTTDNPPPDLRTDEHFQNWMRTAGLPTFTKLYGRNDNDKMQKGIYEITIGLSGFLPGFIDILCIKQHWACSRFPGTPIQGYKVLCDIDSVLDWRKKSFPWLGIRRGGRCIRTLSCFRNSSPPHQAKVCSLDI